MGSANIEGFFSGNRVPPEFDILSIDIDGNDYWVWTAILDWHPRVVVIEYNTSFPPPGSGSWAEDPGHTWDWTNYHGDSLGSLARLGRRKGYSLVATESRGVSAFFVSDDLVIEGQLLNPAAQFHYSASRHGPRGCGHPERDGLYLEINKS